MVERYPYHDLEVRSIDDTTSDLQARNSANLTVNIANKFTPSKT